MHSARDDQGANGSACGFPTACRHGPEEHVVRDELRPLPLKKKALLERAGVSVQRGLSAEVRIQHSGAQLDAARANEIDEGRH